jgi:peptide/nickel transport system permease protein
VLFLVTVGVFLLIHLVPGDPVDAMMGESQDPVAREALRHELGFDQPLYLQYATWLAHVAQGDFGRSVRTHQTVLEDVSQRIRPSLELAIYAMLIAMLVAVPLGILTATHRNSPLDSFGTSFSLFGICMPNFVLALLLIFIFGVSLHWLPIASYTDPFDDPVAGIKSLTLPAITLGLALAAVIARTLRSSLLEVLSEEYIKTARAKGLDSGTVILRHALKNGLIPVVTVLGLQFGTLIGGAVITEYVFAIPGVGRLVVDSVFARDYPLVQGVVLLICVGFIVSNLVVDILYGWLDPRIRSNV